MRGSGTIVVVARSVIEEVAGIAAADVDAIVFG